MNDFVFDDAMEEQELKEKLITVKSPGRDRDAQSKTTDDKVNYAKIKKEKVVEKEDVFVETPPEFIDS